MTREKAMELQCAESMAHNCTRCLGGVSVTPIGKANPISNFSALMSQIRMETDASNQLLILFPRDRKNFFGTMAGIAEKLARVLLGVGMWYPQGSRRDLLRADQRDQLRDVGEFERAENEALGFEDGHTVWYMAAISNWQLALGAREQPWIRNHLGRTSPQEGLHPKGYEGKHKGTRKET